MHSHSSMEQHARIKAACHSMNELLTHLQGGLWYIEAWSYQGGAGLFHWFSGCWIKCPINLCAAALQSQHVAREGERACALVCQAKSLSFLWLVHIHSVIMSAKARKAGRYPGELGGNVSLILSSWEQGH